MFPSTGTDLRHLESLSVFKGKCCLGNSGSTVFSLMKISFNKGITYKGELREGNNTGCAWGVANTSRGTPRDGGVDYLGGRTPGLSEFL